MAELLTQVNKSLLGNQKYSKSVETCIHQSQKNYLLKDCLKLLAMLWDIVRHAKEIMYEEVSP